MTCDPDLAANPTELPDPDGEGVMLYWPCCGRDWFLSPATQREPQLTRADWHNAVEALDEAGLR